VQDEKLSGRSLAERSDFRCCFQVDSSRFVVPLLDLQESEMTEWFFRIKGKRELGPVTSGELLELIRQGTILPHTEIRKDNSRWLAASEIHGLFEAAARPSVAFNCPYCEKPIEKPPCRCRSCTRQIMKATGHLVTNNVEMPNEQLQRPDLD
jgi:hypothetical protein